MDMPKFKLVLVKPRNYNEPRWVKKRGAKYAFKHKHTRKLYDLPFGNRRYR